MASGAPPSALTAAAPASALTAAAPNAAAAAAAPTAELIRLDRLPSGWAHSVSIGRLAPSIDDERLAQVLSDCGGPVANLLLHCAPDRRWATAQFFCEADAERFRTSCDGRPFAGQRIEVKRLYASRGGSSTAPTPAKRCPPGSAAPTPALPTQGDAALDMPASKAISVMNAYLGFGGWSHELLELTTEADTGERAPTYKAKVRVCARGTNVVGVATSGGGASVGEASQVVSESWQGAGTRHCGLLKKAAVTNALKAALQRLAIIRFPANGKVAVRAIGPVETSDDLAAAPSAAPPAKRPRRPPIEDDAMPPPRWRPERAPLGPLTVD